ncbi:MAG: MFS transporter [Acidobacteriota bacterium]
MTTLNESPHLTRQHWAILAFVWAVWFFGFFSLTLLTFLLQPVQDAFGPSESALAWLTGTAIGMTGVGGFVFGALSDRIGRKRSSALAVITFCAGNFLSALAPSFLIFALARGLAGLGIGGTWGAGQALLGETFPPDRRGRFGAIAQTGSALGLGLAAAVGSFAAPRLGWRLVFALAALPVILLPLLRGVPESDVWRRHAERVAGAGRGIGSLARQLLARGTLGVFLACLLLTLLNMSNYWFTVSWLPRYLQKERGLDLARSGWATLAFVLGSFLGYLSFGWVSDRIGRRLAFTLYCALMATGLVMFTVFWPAIALHPTLVLAFLFVAGLGTGTWSGYGPMMSELFPTAVRGTAMSILMNLTRGVQFLAPVVIAAVAPRWGMSGGIALAAGFAVLAGAWIWILPETRGRRIAA